MTRLFSFSTRDGIFPIVGLDWWEYMDKPAEGANWGLVTPKDNAYDGKEAQQARGRDRWGYLTGGEDRNYGDFLSAVENTNLMIDQQLNKVSAEVERPCPVDAQRRRRGGSKGLMFRNVFSNWSGFLLRGVISLVLTPILIHYLGDFQYGLWVLVMSVVDYSGILDLGIRPTLHRFVARWKSLNDRTALNETIGSAFTISCGAGLLVLLVTFSVLPQLSSFFDIQGGEFQRIPLVDLPAGDQSGGPPSRQGFGGLPLRGATL